jgi:hypothetical protein
MGQSQLPSDPSCDLEANSPSSKNDNRRGPRKPHIGYDSIGCCKTPNSRTLAIATTLAIGPQCIVVRLLRGLSHHDVGVGQMLEFAGNLTVLSLTCPTMAFLIGDGGRVELSNLWLVLGFPPRQCDRVLGDLTGSPLIQCALRPLGACALNGQAAAILIVEQNKTSLSLLWPTKMAAYPLSHDGRWSLFFCHDVVYPSGSRSAR